MKRSWHLFFLSAIVPMMLLQVAYAKCIPPIPAKDPPYDQAEWEKTRSLPELKWIQQTKKYIEIKESHRKMRITNLEFALDLDKHGRPSGLPRFQDPQIARKEQITKWIRKLRLPSLPKGMDTMGVTLTFDQNSKVTVRFFKT